MSCLISVVSVAGMSSLFFVGADRADPMPGKNERQGRNTNIFFFHEGSLQGHSQSIAHDYRPRRARNAPHRKDTKHKAVVWLRGRRRYRRFRYASGVVDVNLRNTAVK
jgi:hypothetical protein